MEKNMKWKKGELALFLTKKIDVAHSHKKLEKTFCDEMKGYCSKVVAWFKSFAK